MIPRKRSSGWVFRAVLAYSLVAVFGLTAMWWRSKPPGVGGPDGDIAPLFGAELGEAPSRAHYKGSPYDSIRPVPVSRQPIHMIMVYVHGISCHSPDYSAPFQFRLAKALGMTRVAGANGGAPEVSLLELVPGAPKSSSIPDYLSTSDFDDWRANATPAEVKASYLAMRRAKKIPPEFGPACSNPEKGELVRPLDHPRLSIRHYARGASDRLSVIEVLWSPLSERQKLMKVGEDLNLDASALRAPGIWDTGRAVPRADVEKRALVNQMLKANVINGAIADAIFYLGDGGPDIRAAVMAGIVEAISLRKSVLAEGKHRPRMTVVTESLGSRIAFDTMREAPDRFADELDDTIVLLKSRPRIMMFANQLPLLDIAERSDRSIVDGDAFETELARHTARVKILQAAGDREAAREDYKFFSVSDPPSWRACGEAFQYYIRAATALTESPLGARVGGKSQIELADNMQFALTHPIAPILALFEDPTAKANLPATLKMAKQLAGDAMAFLAYSPGGVGYANCQRKIAEERARVDAHYAQRAPSSPDAGSAIVQIERLLKVASDVRASKIADIDAISNSRASVVFGLLYQELGYLAALCAEPGADVRVCSAPSVVARLRRVAGLVPRIDVLAFSDPNDLLSYRVTAEQYQSETFNFTNVPIRLADPILPTSGTWGGFTPPMEAHTNHKFDNRILAMLVCGWDASAGRTFETVNGAPCAQHLGAGVQ